MSKKLWQKALITAFPNATDIAEAINNKLSLMLGNGEVFANVMKSAEDDVVIQMTETAENNVYSLILRKDNSVYFNRRQLNGMSNNSLYCFLCLALAFKTRKNSLDEYVTYISTSDLTSLEDDTVSRTVPWTPFSDLVGKSLVNNLTFHKSYAKREGKSPIGKIQIFECEGLEGGSSYYQQDDVDLNSCRLRDPESYNELEKDRIINNALVEGFLPTPEDDACISRIYNWVQKKGYAPSFFFYGPAGTGKSEVGKYFSKVTGIPYTFVTCSAMTNEADLRGKPNKLSQNGAIIKFANRLIDNFWKRKIETSDIDSDEIQYSDTELVLACKYGWIIEVQEAAHIIDAGTLGFLNCTLDTNRVLTLPNGKQIKLHPNTTFIFTSNVEYEGCNPFNLSLLSRMCYTRRFDKMSFNAQIERVMSVTGYNNREDVSRVIKAIDELNNIIVDNDITQGICDLRSAINCITDYQICGGSLRQSAKLTIEDKVSLESGYEEEIRLKLDSILGLI